MSLGALHFHLHPRTSQATQQELSSDGLITRQMNSVWPESLERGGRFRVVGLTTVSFCALIGGRYTLNRKTDLVIILFFFAF